jgi:hypothetical protein
LRFFDRAVKQRLIEKVPGAPISLDLRFFDRAVKQSADALAESLKKAVEQRIGHHVRSPSAAAARTRLPRGILPRNSPTEVAFYSDPAAHWQRQIV